MKFSKAKVTLEQAVIQLAVREHLSRQGFVCTGPVSLRNWELTDRGPTVYEASVEVENYQPPAKSTADPDLV